MGARLRRRRPFCKLVNVTPAGRSTDWILISAGGAGVEAKERIAVGLGCP